MVFTQFDRDALIAAMIAQRGDKVNRIEVERGGEEDSSAFVPMSMDQWDAQMTEQVAGGGENPAESIMNHEATIQYADELPPFDVTISFANEYGRKAMLQIFGLEILNEGTGYSIDSVTTEKACTFVARRIGYMKPLTDDGSDIHPSMFGPQE